MLAPADWQMRVLTPIIPPQALLMNRVQTKVPFRSTIRAEFVGHDRRRRKALPLQSLRINRSAALVFRRRWTRKSKTSPSLSTARQR